MKPTMTPAGIRCEIKRQWSRKGWVALGVALLLSVPVISAPAPSVGASVILISVDTLRADRLSCYGYRGLQTSAMDALAQNGTIFSQANSQVPLTLPSHTSLLTSTLPFSNGVQDHGQPLPAKVTTLASVLQGRGYRTAAFVGGFVLDKRFGLGKGFEVYDSPFNLRRQGRADPGDVRRLGDDVIRSASEWLLQNKSGPFFAFVHLYDLHLPYEIPGVVSGSRTSGYDAALAYEDQVIGRFWSFLQKQGLPQKTLIIFTSDHGESLWEHGESTHGYFIYQSTLRVPLIIHWPAGTGSFPSRVDGAVSLLDVAPTILQFLEISRPAEFQGKGLLDLLQAKTRDTDREIFSESAYARNHFGCSWLRSLRLGHFKFIDAPSPEFYNLNLDPGEQRNLYAQQKALAAGFRQRLQALQARYQTLESDTAVIPNPEVTAALSSLGYMALSTAKKPSYSSGADPKDRVADFEATRRAVDLSRTGKTAEAQGLLDSLGRKYPDVVDLQINRGLNMRRMGKGREAVDVFRQALKQDPLDVRGHFNLAVALNELAEYEEALKELRAVLAISPTYNRAQELIGAVLLSKGDEPAAQEHFGRLLKADPQNYAAHYHLGMSATRKGNWAEAEHHFSIAVGSDPLAAEAQNGLGVVYLQTGKLAHAQRTFEEAVRLEPKWAETHFNLGLVLRQLGRKEDAALEFRAALAADPQFQPAREALNSPEFRSR